MRFGQILAETTPSKLLERFQSDSLEEAFLALSQIHQENRDKGIVNETIIEDNDEDEGHITHPQPERKLSKSEESNRFFESLKFCIFRALLIKNYLQIIRNPG